LLAPSQRKNRSKKLLGEVEKIIKSMDQNGRWVRGDMIHIADFVVNFELLCKYLELSETLEGESVLYSYCSWLLTKEQGMSFTDFQEDEQQRGYSERIQRAAYRLPIGEPLSKQYSQNACLIRDYENAKILVNPTEESRKVIIDKNKLWLNWTSKKTVNSLVLRGQSATILLPTPYK